MMSNQLPSVLTPPAPFSAISMERALKQIKKLLEQCDIDPALEDELATSIDDVDVMLQCINRG